MTSNLSPRTTLATGFRQYRPGTISSLTCIKSLRVSKVYNNNINSSITYKHRGNYLVLLSQR